MASSGSWRVDHGKSRSPRREREEKVNSQSHCLLFQPIRQACRQLWAFCLRCLGSSGEWHCQHCWQQLDGKRTWLPESSLPRDHKKRGYTRAAVATIVVIVRWYGGERMWRADAATNAKLNYRVPHVKAELLSGNMLSLQLDNPNAGEEPPQLPCAGRDRHGRSGAGPQPHHASFSGPHAGHEELLASAPGTRPGTEQRCEVYAGPACDSCRTLSCVRRHSPRQWLSGNSDQRNRFAGCFRETAQWRRFRLRGCRGRTRVFAKEQSRNWPMVIA